MIVPPHWFVEPVTIETHTGQGAYGDNYAAPVTVLGHISGGRRVNSSAAGEEVVSSQRLLLPNPTRLADGSGTVDPSVTLTPESRVSSGTITGTVGRVEEHRKPGTGSVVYVSADLV